MHIVKTSLRCESGRVWLKLTNGFDKIVTVKQVRQVSSSGVGAAGSLWLQNPIKLDSNSSQEVDITDKLRLMFNFNSPKRQEKPIAIGLSLEPGPRNQPLLHEYLVVVEKGQFVEFLSK